MSARRYFVCDRLGWPVERVKGCWAFNFLRLLIHGRKLRRLWIDGEGGVLFSAPCHGSMSP